MLTPNALTILGFDQSHPNGESQVLTANGWVNVEEFRLDSLTALGVRRSPMDVLLMDLQNADYEGLLAMDFFRDNILTIDFRNGTIDLM